MGERRMCFQHTEEEGSVMHHVKIGFQIVSHVRTPHAAITSIIILHDHRITYSVHFIDDYIR